MAGMAQTSGCLDVFCFSTFCGHVNLARVRLGMKINDNSFRRRVPEDSFVEGSLDVRGAGPTLTSTAAFSNLRFSAKIQAIPTRWCIANALSVELLLGFQAQLESVSRDSLKQAAVRHFITGKKSRHAMRKDSHPADVFRGLGQLRPNPSWSILRFQLAWEMSALSRTSSRWSHRRRKLSALPLLDVSSKSFVEHRPWEPWRWINSRSWSAWWHVHVVQPWGLRHLWPCAGATLHQGSSVL